MTADWTPTSQALPPDDCVVEFVLDHRDMAMTGTYRQRTFVSRWSTYDTAAVREWRVAPARDDAVGTARAPQAA